MFFKKKIPAAGNDVGSVQGNMAAAALDPGALKARVIGLECSLSPESLRVLGAMDWASRIADVQVSESAGGPQVRVEFFSDSLALDAKTALEDFIVSSMRSRYPSVARWVVYMRRREAAPAPSTRPPSAGDRPGEGRSAGGAPARPNPNQNGSGAAEGPQPASRLAGSRKPIEGVRSIIAVASGKGGVGKSTVSVNLAIALVNQGYRVGILDADIYGPSLPMMLGVGAQPTVNESNKIVPPEKHGLKVMSFGFFAGEDAAVIWRGPMVMKALQQFFYDVAWGDLDYLVIDLPPGTGDAQLTLVQSLPVDGAVIVTTPQNVALLDAVKGVVMFRKTEVPVLGVVENMSVFHCPSCGHECAVFGEGGADVVSKKFDVPVLGHVPLNPAIRTAGDDGQPLALVTGHPVRVRFAEIASRVTERLMALAQQGTTPKVSPFVASAQGTVRKGGSASGDASTGALS